MKLTIIITTKNRVRYLARALEALIEEKNKKRVSIEIVVTDGGSTDGTVELLERKNEHIDRWVSQPDNGVAEGVNRAYSLATGEILWVTGDDDTIVPGAAEKMIAYMDSHPDVDVLFGQNQIVMETDEGVITPVFNFPKTVGGVSKDTLLQMFFKELVVPETCFMRKYVADAVRGYDTGFHYYAFWDYFFRIEEAGFRMLAVEQDVIIRHITPVSDTLRSYSPKAIAERDRVIEKYGGARWLTWHRYGGKHPNVADRVTHNARRVCKALGSITGIHPRHLLGSRFGRQR